LIRAERLAKKRCDHFRATTEARRVNDTLPPEQPQTRWRPDRTPQRVPWPVPPIGQAFGRGLCMRCPACGKTRLFAGYLTVTPVCSACGAPLGRARADDAPPYFTIILVAHIIIPSMWLLERTVTPPLWVHAAIWVPLTLVLTLALLRPVKGATVGLALRFGLLKTRDDE
jgi:uncharacterized protein (DUF983 family)